METNTIDSLNDPNNHLDQNNISNPSAADDGIGENSEQTPLAEARDENDPGKSLHGSEGGNGWSNNKPGATNEEKNEKLIPVPSEDKDENTTDENK